MIRVTNIRAAADGTGTTVSAILSCEEADVDRKELWFRYPLECHEYASSSADPWIAVLLWPAMRLGQRLVVDAAASAQLMANLPTLMSIMHCWDARFRPIEVETSGTSPRKDAGPAVASFFSGGVDSFYTVLKNMPSAVKDGEGLTHLISVHGLDVWLREGALWEQIQTHLRDAAEQLGCTFVGASTNVRDVIPDRLVTWPMHYGAVLAAIAMGLQGFWGKVFIPAAQTYAALYPGGSHPLLDPLWSTESTAIVNDGAEATRIQKIMWQIARSNVALRHLRVCWKNPNGQYNCGQCEKCIRTMVSLKIAGVLTQCESFDRPLRYQDIRRILLAGPAQQTLMAQNYEAARAAGSDPALIRAVRSALYPPFHRKVRRGLSRRMRRLGRKIKGISMNGVFSGWRREEGA